MVILTLFMSHLIVFSNHVFGSVLPSYALTETASSISNVVPNQFPSGVEWDQKTNEMIQRYQDREKIHESLLRDYKKLTKSKSAMYPPPSQDPMDYKDGRYKRSKSDFTSHKRTTPKDVEKLKYMLSKLDRIDKNLQKIISPDGEMRYEGKRVYTTEELKHIENKVKGLQTGYDYIYLGDGKFVRAEEGSCDLSGIFGKIRAFDEDGETILYETGCCFYNWNSFSPGENSLLEHMVWFTACLPFKAVYDFVDKTWKSFEEKFLNGLSGLY
ncbi:secreted protein [Melampsora americana]|nr:secreted protein [Melampsora americana]